MTLSQLLTLINIHREVNGLDGKSHQQEKRIDISDEKAAAILAGFASGQVV